MNFLSKSLHLALKGGVAGGAVHGLSPTRLLLEMHSFRRDSLHLALAVCVSPNVHGVFVARLHLEKYVLHIALAKGVARGFRPGGIPNTPAPRNVCFS